LRLMKPCRLLDVGCGSGLNTQFWGYRSSIHALKKRGFEVVGLEYSEKAREIARAQGLTAVSSFAQLEGQVFDCIRMNWSLEHVDSPAKFFEASRRLLKPKGKLIIAVPNYDGILYKLYPHCVEVPVHTYYFTPQTLEKYLEKYEFEVVDRFTFSYPGMFVFASKILGHNPRFILSPLQGIYFQSIVNQFDHQMLGNDMVYLSQKK
jgi:SAM-dependent methyltransferase